MDITEGLRDVQRFLNTCEAGDYSTSFVCYPSFDENMYKEVCAKVDFILDHNAKNDRLSTAGKKD